MSEAKALKDLPGQPDDVPGGQIGSKKRSHFRSGSQDLYCPGCYWTLRSPLCEEWLRQVPRRALALAMGDRFPRHQEGELEFSRDHRWTSCRSWWLLREGGQAVLKPGRFPACATYWDVLSHGHNSGRGSSLG